jgi:predicted Zn-dependent protease with MMP-like domain
MRLSRKRFEALVLQALETIPEGIQARMDNVDIVIEDRPADDRYAALDLEAGELLFGLYEGTPLIDRGITADPLLPDKITIFQEPLEDACPTDAEIAEEIRKTVIHEVAHHFGLDESALADLGYD